MERLTEYHCGVAVIKDKTKHKEAMARLAKIEDIQNIPETVCDRYCKYPDILPNQDSLDKICAGCKLSELFDLLT